MSGPDDKDVWQAYAAKVKRTPSSKNRVTKIAAKKPTPRVVQQQPTVPPFKIPRITSKKSEFITPLDRRKEKQVRDGSLAIEARLDMHGLTQTEAYAALATFMMKQVLVGRRNVLIVTGKGRGGAGVLRTNLVSWLETLDCAAHILAVRSAAICHGGAGAFYVILRRKDRM